MTDESGEKAVDPSTAANLANVAASAVMDERAGMGARLAGEEGFVDGRVEAAAILHGHGGEEPGLSKDRLDEAHRFAMRAGYKFADLAQSDSTKRPDQFARELATAELDTAGPSTSEVADRLGVDYEPGLHVDQLAEQDEGLVEEARDAVSQSYDRGGRGGNAL